MAIEFVGYSTASANGNQTISASLTSLTGGISSSVASGDFVIASLGVAYNAFPGLDYPAALQQSGYTTRVDGIHGDDTTRSYLWVFTKIMGASPDSVVSFSTSGSSSIGETLIAYVFRNVDSTTPLDVALTTATGTNEGRPTPPAITPTTSGSIIVCIGAGGDNDGLWTFTTATLSGFATVGYDGTYDPALGVGYYSWSSGTYTPAQFGQSQTSGTDAAWTAATLALRPVASAIKSVVGLAKASVKSKNGLAITSIKSINGLA